MSEHVESTDADNDDKVDRAFLSRENKRLKKCKWNGVQYATRSLHEGNSQIIFNPACSTDLVPGYILDIIEADEPILIVHRLEPAVDLSFDAFQQYQDFPASIFSRECRSQPEIVHCRMVHGHFASFPLGERNLVVLRLFNARHYSA